MKALHSLAILAFFSFASSVLAQKAKRIEKAELSKWINQKYDCSADAPVYFYRFDHHDFLGDGDEQAIVVASSCESGTGGPDIHSVFARDSDGELEVLKIAEVDPKTYDNLFGNRNCDLVAENGLLLANIEDDPDRSLIPLIIRYKWNGKEFAVDSIHKTGVYPTSYDCTKTLTEVENAICHVKELADLDRELGAIYKALLAKLSPTDSAAVRVEQRAWLSSRENHCALYKGWISCLTDYYQQRIDELKKRSVASQTPKTPQTR